MATHGTATGVTDFVGSFGAIESIVGGAERDTLSAPSTPNNWLIDGASSGEVIGQVVFSGFEVLEGGDDVDTVDIFADVTFAGSISSGAGEDTFTLPSNTFVLEGIDGGEDADSYLIAAATGATTVQLLSDSGENGNDHLTVVGTQFAEAWFIAPTHIEINTQRIEFPQGLDSIDVETLEGADLILIAPSEVPVQVNAGLPEPPSLFSDTMVVDAMGMDVIESEGSVTVGDLTPITHEGVELVLIANPPAQPAQPVALERLRDRLFRATRRDMMAPEVDHFWEALDDVEPDLLTESVAPPLVDFENELELLTIDEDELEAAFRGRRRSSFGG